MNTVRKRIFCITTALLLAVSSLLSSSVPVRAASIPVVPDSASSESLMTLLNLLVNAWTAGGAAESAADYNSEVDLLDAFLDFAKNIVPVGQAPEARFYFSDGTSVTMDDLCTGLEDGTVTLPNEQEWGKYRVGFGDDFASILEAWEERGNGSGGNGDDPEDPNEPEFSKVETFVINSGFLAMISDFFSALWNGEIEGLSYKDICDFPEYYYDPQSTGGISYTFGPIGTISPYHHYTNPSYYAVSKHYFCFVHYRDDRSTSYGVPCIWDTYEYYGLRNDKLYSPSIPGNVGSSFTIDSRYVSIDSPYVAFTNYPIFSDRDAALNYLLTGDAAGVINGLRYDYASLNDSIRTILAPMAGVKLSPSALQKTYSSMKTAYQTDISSQPATDVTTDTGIYIDTMTDTIVDTMPSVTPSPSPDPDPGGTGTGTGTETGTDVDIDDYKRDLRLIFPFCLPFDFIALLDALDADPVAPCFTLPFVIDALDINMTVELDMAFLDEVAQIIRTCETVGFIITLIILTGRLIKW